MANAGIPNAGAAAGGSFSIAAIGPLTTYAWPRSNAAHAEWRQALFISLRMPLRLAFRTRHMTNGNAREPRTRKLAVAGRWRL